MKNLFTYLLMANLAIGYTSATSKAKTIDYSEESSEPATVTLKDLTNHAKGTYNIVGTDLQAITAVYDQYRSRYYVLVKDGNGNSNEKVQHNEGLGDYLVNGHNQDNYDQSNWLMVEVTEKDYINFDKKDYMVTSITGGKFNGLIGDPVVEAVDNVMPVITYGEKGAEYVPNQYCCVNFIAHYTSDYSGNSIASREGRHNPPGKPGNYFFMNPKYNEYCIAVWAVWNTDYNNFFVPVSDASNNRWNFGGGYDIDLDYNEGDVKDHSDMTDQQMYNFPAIVKALDPEWVERAPGKSRVVADADNDYLSTYYLVYPLELNRERSVITAVSDVQAPKTVQHVRYYNLAGIESSEPAPGLNIVVTTYTDGTTQTAKVMK